MQKKTYSFEEHGLALDQIDPDALYVMEKLRQAGYTSYLVGGSVRDLLLQQTPKDYDISTSAEPEEIRKLFRNCILIGRRFRLAHIRFGKKALEVSTFRSGDTGTDELIVRDNIWGSPEEDAMRRDFSINGLFYDSATQEIIDYVGGFPDIQRKYLRTIGQPYLRFKQDPVRMIRLVKFQARFGFEIDKESHIALLECRHEILKSAPARVLEELLRMLESSAANSFFRLMAEQGLLQLLMPVLGSYLETRDGEEVYGYLQEIDTTFHAPHLPLLERPILLSCLLFPLFQKRIQTHFLDREVIPHLGNVQQASQELIDEIFHPFFHLPRRLRTSIVSILTTQYRLTPIEKKRLRRLRIPHDPDFPLALKFLEIRSCLEPGLQTILQEWQSCFGSQETTPQPRRRNRRRRRRHSSGGRPENS